MSAMKSIETTAFDIVMIEIELLGGTGGTELARNIREFVGESSQMPIVGITSKKEMSESPEFHQILISPITKDAVNSMLVSYFRQAHASKAMKKIGQSLGSLVKKPQIKSSLRILIVEGLNPNCLLSFV